MNRKETIELAHWAVKAARESGADNAAVNVARSRSISVRCRQRALETLQESTENGLSLDVYADGKYSSHSTNDLRKNSLQPFISEAVAMTKYLSKDQYRSLPDPEYYQGRQEIDLQTEDAAYESLDSDGRVKLAQEIEDVALGLSDQIISATAYFSDSKSDMVKVHSNGFEGGRSGTSYSMGMEVSIMDDQGGRPQDWDYRTVRYFDQLPQPDEIARSAVERTIAKSGQTKLESGVYDMVVENRTATRLLGALLDPMQGGALQQKRSFLEGKKGSKVFSDKLTWIDDPFVEQGLGSRTFDGEGMTTKKRVVIDQGVLNDYYISWYYSRKLDVSPTTGGTTNVILVPGTKSFDDLVGQMKKGILVTSFIGGNSNGTTGDFSYGVIGQYVENGKIVKPVSEMNISGNFIDLFGNLTELGNDVYTYSSWRRPSLYFKDVQFSGV